MRRRDALSDLALHFLNKMKIMVVKDIEREEIEFICKVSDAGRRPLLVSPKVALISTWNEMSSVGFF